MSILRGPHGVPIMLLWIAGVTALCAAWWLGRRLTVSRRWILVTAALWIAPLLLVPPLASRDVYAYACQGSLFDAGLNPSVVGISAQPCPWIESVSVVWRDTPTPYGPLWIVLTGLAASFGSQAVAVAIFRLYAVLAVAGLAVAVPALARRTGVREERALWLVLCCPLVPVHMVGGSHNDALTMALLLAGLALVTGRRTPAGPPAVPVASAGPPAVPAVPAGAPAVPVAPAGPPAVPVASAGPPAVPVAPAGPPADAASGELPATDAAPASSSGAGAGAGAGAGVGAGAGAGVGGGPGGRVLVGGWRGTGVLVAGGALVGAAIAVKTTVGVVLPFAVLIAAGGLELNRAGLLRFVRRGAAVVGGALAALAGLSVVSGLGFGWAVALSGAGESRSWTSPPTAVGIAVNAVGKWFGAGIDVVPAVRTVALVLLLGTLVGIWWRFRRGDALRGAGLACLAVIFFAPITQPWYLFWTLALFAVTTVRMRWFELTVVASMFLILPNGDGAWKPLQVPFAFLVTGLAGWVAWRTLRRPGPAVPS
ncbi:polyprenol phosphomannose-dependent alpha 1,6 mannosyltransferase MptB [Pseudosporangium ferrugineum]|nr:polyprenol phosphomannose-dependent alpha 1,6 mannosyltransferase MptB [Pseudosporangium ferrugineum]